MSLIRLKNELRQKMKTKLDSVSYADYQNFNNNLYRNFCELELLKTAKKIMIYYSVRKEVKTEAIINFLLKKDKMVALPVCLPERELKAALIKDLSRLQPAAFGLMEPGPDAAILNPDQIDLIIAPGVAFDEKGRRLGHGAGYYDRFLSKTANSFILGLAYDFQVVAEVPLENHDIRMNGILTPSRYLEFNS
jgi:5-formyltetrahydrofolate cyclo-ligase